MQAADGNTMSGVEVATMIRSISLGAHAGRLERVARGLERRGRCALTSACGEVARADAGALDDPLVGRLDAVGRQFGGQVGVGHAARRQVAAGAGDARIAWSCETRS